MRIHSFESMATLDGEGIRYGVFLTGCPLRCVYCHNPDTWTAEGTEYSPEALAKKIKRYKPYFGKLGGVTFSGGEPLLSAHDINLVNEHLRTDSINYALDTSGCVSLNNEVKKAVNNASMIICDIKMWNDETYLKYMGVDMSLVLQFLDYVKESGTRLWLRTVIVPGINDSTDILDHYIAIAARYPNAEKYELLGFHTMGFFKYDNLGINNPLAETPDLDKDKLEKLQAYVNKAVLYRTH